MTNKSSARNVALQILHKTFEGGAYTNLALNEVLQKNNLSHLDRRLVTELVYGSVKNKGLLDYWLKKFIPKYDKLPIWIALNLVLAVYQLAFMDKIPANAAVNEAVELAKKYGHKGTISLTNAVLRKMLRTENSFALPEQKGNQLQYLAVKYSHPEWIVALWLKAFGLEETEALLAANNANPPLTIRVNTLKTSSEALQQRLTKDGAICQPGRFLPYAFNVQSLPSLHDYPPFLEGHFQIQDESSMLVGAVLDPQPEETVIDACAAPGGKSTHIAQLMANQGKVLSFDIYEHKIKLIKENADRLGLKIIIAKQLDARLLATKYTDIAERVLVDAPCSGLGVLRRRPDARWRKEFKDFQSLTVLQSEILQEAAKTVKKGGVLVYSTCTINPDENTGTVQRFLAANPEFIPEDITPYLPKVLQSIDTVKQGYLTLYPHLYGSDGFFIYRMRRR